MGFDNTRNISIFKVIDLAKSTYTSYGKNIQIYYFIVYFEIVGV
ncbi:MAG: hypothetical protein RSD36_18540 [Terrisporobacter sp.]